MGDTADINKNCRVAGLKKKKNCDLLQFILMKLKSKSPNSYFR